MEDQTPTDDDFAKAIKPLWLKAKPSRRAQGIRAALSVSFDDPRRGRLSIDARRPC
jgi:hypothetical protein